MIRVVFLILLTAGLCLGQDTTCNSGDVLWVVETVTADTDVAAGGAEYNNSAAPFGIQGGLDTVNLCNGAIVRILYGANNYGPSSSSWTNRESSTKQIRAAGDWDSGNAYVNFVRVEGWADTTHKCGTSGYRWTSVCPVTLDFDRDNITGAGGFYNPGGGYVFKWLKVKNVDGDGWTYFDSTTSNVYFESVAVENATGFGLRLSDRAVVRNSYFVNVAEGSGAAMSLKTGNVLVGNVIDCDSAGSPISTQRATSVTAGGGGNGLIAYNNVIRNCGGGFEIAAGDYDAIIRNTFRNITGDCIVGSASSPDGMIVVDNLFNDCGTASVSLIPGTSINAALLSSGNAYAPSVPQLNIFSAGNVLIDPSGSASDLGPTSTGCSFTSSTDETLDTACGESVILPAAQIASQDTLVPGIAIGSLETPAATGGGETSYVSFQ